MDALTRSEAAVLEAIHARGKTTRGDLAGAVDLSMAMTARIVARLQEAGLVREAGRSSANGSGRQAHLLEVQPRAAYVVGVDVGPDLVHLLVADLHGVPIASRTLPSAELAGASQAAIVAALAALVRALLADAAIPAARLAAAGVAVTGIIDSGNGVCLLRSTTPGWEDFALAEALGAALDAPVLLEETARAKSLAELRLGAARSARCPLGSFLYVEAGAAVGASIVIDRRPFHGLAGLAGELGHVTVDPGGTLCRCGNRGCLQATASGRAIVAHARDLLQRGVFSSLAGRAETLTIADVGAAADDGDPMALGLLTEAGERLGLAISMALNLLGLDLVVLGGALTRCSPVVLDAATRVVRLRVLPIVPRPRTLVPSELGDDAAARGAALQAIDWLFAEPSGRLLPRVNAAGAAAPGVEAMARNAS